MEHRLLPGPDVEGLLENMALKHRPSRLGSEAGFTLLEVLVVVGLMGVVAAMAIMVSPTFTQTKRSDSGLEQALDAIRSAREMAISQRRNVRLNFVGITAFQTVREDINSTGVVTGTTILRTVQLENRMQLRLDPDVSVNTPDAFPTSARPSAATAFSGPAPVCFTSEGTFVDANGDPTNGTITLSVPGEKNSARAVTIMGATALIRSWRWNGSAWVE
jgi:prepilin-type N-terminal cleavage/methylation domain-containing protein